MSYRARSVEYFYATVKDRPGEAYQVLTALESGEVNLLAFNIVPMGPNAAQLALFPEDPGPLLRVAEREGMTLIGPQAAILVQGDDRMGALAEVHSKLQDASVNIFASSGVSDGRGCYGYLLYVKPEDIERAESALGAA